VTVHGLRLYAGRKEEVCVPVGTPVRYLGGNRLLVPLDDRDIELAVGHLLIYRQRLARDVATFLSGDRAQPRPGDYRWPWYVVLLWLAPAGLPLLAGSLSDRGEGRGMLFLSVLGAAFLFFLLYGLLQRERWAHWLRLLLAAGVSAAAYLTLVWAVERGSALGLSPRSWQPLQQPGVYRLRMPGRPVLQTRLRDGRSVVSYIVDLKRQQTVFTFGFVDVPAGPRNPTDQQLKTLFDDSVQALQRETTGIRQLSVQPLALKSGTCPGREYVFRVSNRTLTGMMVARLVYDQGRLYSLVVSGKNVKVQSPEVRQFFDSFTLE
jgi:hypothetical protein